MLRDMSTSPATQDGREIGDGLGLFLQRIARTRLLTHAEELELARRIERGDLEAKDRMIEANMRLVVHLAKRFQREDSGMTLLHLRDAVDPPGDRSRDVGEGPGRAPARARGRPGPQAAGRGAPAGDGAG